MQARNKKKMIFSWALAIGWVGVLFFLSGQTAVESGELSGLVTQLLMRVLGFLQVSAQTMEFLLRKAAHFAIFAVEGMLLLFALNNTLPGRRGRQACLAALGCAGLAVLNELHQMFSDGRSCELRDMLIDFAGSCAGICAGLVILAVLARRRRAR